jgi:CubicO group peptidase (beta-lactamase class C family)
MGGYFVERKRKFLRLSVVLIMLGIMVISNSALAATTYGEKDSTPSGISYSELKEKIDQFIEERKEGTASVSLAVFNHQDTLYDKQYGYANIGTKLAVDENTVYEWGSVTKLLVWVSVMQLYEQGKIDLDTDIREYLPEHFLTKLAYDKPITMIHLMNHTAGWQETTYDIETASSSEIVSLKQALRQSEPAQVNEPGTVTAYSNWGTSLAAYIVERITGEDFCDYVHQHIFEPLHMEHTGLAPDLADNSWVKQQRLLLNCYSIMQDSSVDYGKCIRYILLYPSGSATGTLEDFATFAKAFVPEEGKKSPFFQKRDTLDLMLSATSTYGDSHIARNCHGLWTLQYSANVMGHNGNTEGCTSTLMFEPNTGTGIVIMTNEVGETSYNFGLLSLLFGDYDTNESITKSPSLGGIYTSCRSYEKGFTRIYKYLGSLMPLSETKDEKTFKLSIGQGKLTQVADNQYIMDNENGFKYLMYRTTSNEGETRLQMMSQDVVRENTIAFWCKIVSLAFMVISILFSAVALLVGLLRILIRRLTRKGRVRSNNQCYQKGRTAVLISNVVVGIILYYLILLPLDGGSITLIQVAWKCVLIGILSLIPLINLFIIILKWKVFVGRGRQRAMYIVTECLGLIVTFNIWFWQLYNFWSC